MRDLISSFTVGVQFSLGSGAHHRWYDIRGSLTFSFTGLSKQDPRYGKFGACLVHPHACFGRAMQKWKEICSAGKPQSWRVQRGLQGEMRTVRLLKVILDEANEVRCDWRELLDAYFEAGPAVPSN